MYITQAFYAPSARTYLTTAKDAIDAADMQYCGHKMSEDISHINASTIKDVRRLQREDDPVSPYEELERDKDLRNVLRSIRRSVVSPADAVQNYVQSYLNIFSGFKPEQFRTRTQADFEGQPEMTTQDRKKAATLVQSFVDTKAAFDRLAKDHLDIQEQPQRRTN